MGNEAGSCEEFSMTNVQLFSSLRKRYSALELEGALLFEIWLWWRLFYLHIQVKLSNLILYTFGCTNQSVTRTYAAITGEILHEESRKHSR